jgi:DNA-binding response OmpR family regulator
LAAMKILVIEDEEPLADVISTGLRQEGYIVQVALDGNTIRQYCLT